MLLTPNIPTACSYSGTGHFTVLAQHLCSYIANQIEEWIQGQITPPELSFFLNSDQFPDVSHQATA